MMNTKTCFAILVGVISIAAMNTTQKTDIHKIRQKDKLALSIFYSARSERSMTFFLDIFIPHFCKIEKYVTLNLVPCGRSYSIKTATSVNFECEYGNDDCLYNRVHTCVFRRIPTNYIAQVKFVGCAMDTQKEWNCTEGIGLSGVNIKNIGECAKGPQGFHLMMRNELETAEKTKGMIYDPTVVFNDFYSNRDQEQALRDFESILCKKLENRGFKNVCKPIDNVLRLIEECKL